MTLEEFLEEMKAIPGEWRLDGGQYLRIHDSFSCPVTTVCQQKTGMYYPAMSYLMAADAIHLPVALAIEIAEAADGRENCNPNLRQQLLRIARL